MNIDKSTTAPDESSNHGAEKVSQLRAARLDRLGRAIIRIAVLYMAVYFPYFFWHLYRIGSGVNVSLFAILPAHFLCMALNFAAFAFTIRDLYRRSFPNSNTKLTWALLISLTGGIGWLVYVFKYAVKPVDHSTVESPASLRS